MAKILIVDDDLQQRELAKHFLTRAGFDTLEARDGLDALRILESAKADAVVLDLMMPKMDGWELCRTLKATWDLPIIMVTALGETVQKVKGFEQGADDYLVKPFDPPELVVRVQALLRRFRIEASKQARVGQLTVDRVLFQVTCGDETLVLPPKEFDLLYKLAGYPGKTFSRDQLIEDLWGYDFDGNERTLDVHICRLRDRFPEAVSGIRIKAIRGLGYRLEIVT